MLISPSVFIKLKAKHEKAGTLVIQADNAKLREAFITLNSLLSAEHAQYALIVDGTLPCPHEHDCARVRARPLGIDGGLAREDMVGTDYMDPPNDANAVPWRFSI